MPLRFIFAKPVAVEQDIGHPPHPTLGEIVDKLNENKLEPALQCDAALRERRVVRVEIRP